MVVRINKNTTRAEFEEKLESVNPKKSPLNLNEFSNISTFKKVDPLAFQKKIRNEWD